MFDRPNIVYLEHTTNLVILTREPILIFIDRGNSSGHFTTRWAFILTALNIQSLY